MIGCRAETQVCALKMMAEVKGQRPESEKVIFLLQIEKYVKEVV